MNAEPDNINYIRSFEWLQNMDQDRAIAFGSRVALRVMPFLALPVFKEAIPGEGKEKFSTEFLVPVFRAILTATVATCKKPSAKIKVAAEMASKNAARNDMDSGWFLGTRPAAEKAALRDARTELNSSGFSTTIMATEAATLAAKSVNEFDNDGKILSGANSIKAAARSGRRGLADTCQLFIEDGTMSSSGTARTAARLSDSICLARDKELLDNIADGRSIFLSELWAKDSILKGALESWRELRKLFLQEKNWEFWIDWYERHLEGHPQNWEMLEKIALIPNGDWQKGAVHLNTIISDIRFGMEPGARAFVRISATEFLSEEQRLGIGGNLHPSKIEDSEIPITRADLETLQESVAKLVILAKKNELPDRSAVAAEVEVVRNMWVKLRDWCARHVDEYTTEFSKESARQHAKLLFAYGPILGTLYIAFEAWLQTLP